MTEGILGKKLGMTQVFIEGGRAEAVTAIEAGPCTVMQVKTLEKEGYSAVKLGFGEAKKRKSDRKRADDTVKHKYLREFKPDESQTMESGQIVDAGLFKTGDKVDVTGISRVRRYGKTPQLRGRPQDAWTVRPPPRPGLHRLGHHSRPCFQGDENVRSHGA